MRQGLIGGRFVEIVPLEPVAEEVFRIQGNPGRLNVYFIRQGDRVTMFDAGGRMMADAVRQAAASLGRLEAIVLSHGHTDHRGTAPFLGADVLCHPDEVTDAAGSGGFRYWGKGLPQLQQPHRFLQRDLLHPRFWDGGPVRVSATLTEGDEIAGFRVLDLSGHAPGQIALVRERDGIALVGDAFYTIDPWGRDTSARLPDTAWNFDNERTIASLLKLADLDPSSAWPGHGEPVRDSVGRKLADAARIAHQPKRPFSSAR